MNHRFLSLLIVSLLLALSFGCDSTEDKTSPEGDGGTKTSDGGVDGGEADAGTTMVFENADRSIWVRVKNDQVPAGGITIQDIDAADAPTELKDLVADSDLDGFTKIVDLGPDGSTFDPPLELHMVFDVEQDGTGTKTAYVGVGLHDGDVQALEPTDYYIRDDGKVEAVYAVDKFSTFATTHAQVDAVAVYKGSSGPFDLHEPFETSFEVTVNDIT
ncbi:MAG: hypothetical protein KC416_13000, partial [Myxococcales bacterium]|nr:hypothetical protein [Myxococcales bacterium]